MSDKKMSPELQIAIRRSPDYTAPSAELVALRAEVAAWRRAVRWRNTGSELELRVGLCSRPVEVGNVRLRLNGWTQCGNPGWRANAMGSNPVEALPDSNTACAKVCELLGIPVVLPVGGDQ